MKLREKDQQRLNAIFLALLPVHFEVWAYGSRVNGLAHEGSDLDLAIKSPDGKLTAPTLLRRLRTAFTESQIPILIDLHDFAALPPSFQEVVTREGVRIFPET